MSTYTGRRSGRGGKISLCHLRAAQSEIKIKTGISIPVSKPPSSFTEALSVPVTHKRSETRGWNDHKMHGRTQQSGRELGFSWLWLLRWSTFLPHSFLNGLFVKGPLPQLLPSYPAAFLWPRHTSLLPFIVPFINEKLNPSYVTFLFKAPGSSAVPKTNFHSGTNSALPGGAHLLQLLPRHVAHLQLGPVLVQQRCVSVLRFVPTAATVVHPSTHKHITAHYARSTRWSELAGFRLVMSVWAFGRSSLPNNW